MTQQLAPAWMRSVADQALRSLDTALHDKAVVCAVAVLGQEGYEYTAEDNMQELDAEVGVRVLLEGYAMMGAASLGALMDQAYREIAADLPDKPPLPGTPEADELLLAHRKAYEAAIRRWLGSTMQYAAEKFQQDHPSDMSVAAGSQMLALFMRIAQATMRFTPAKGTDGPGRDQAADDT